VEAERVSFLEISLAFVLGNGKMFLSQMQGDFFMHELGVTQEIFNIVMREAKKHGAKRVLKVEVEVGEFSTIEPEPVKLYFEVVSKGSIAEGAEVEVRKLPIRVKCNSCGHEYTAEKYDLTCPRCGSIDVEIIGGRELIVTKIDVE